MIWGGACLHSDSGATSVLQLYHGLIAAPVSLNAGRRLLLRHHVPFEHGKQRLTKPCAILAHVVEDVQLLAGAFSLGPAGGEGVRALNRHGGSSLKCNVPGGPAPTVSWKPSAGLFQWSNFERRLSGAWFRSPKIELEATRGSGDPLLGVHRCISARK